MSNFIDGYADLADGMRLQSLVEISLQTLRVEVTTLVIWGERDQALLTGNLDDLEEHVSDLKVERIAEGSHWIAHEQPGRVNRLIREFL